MLVKIATLLARGHEYTKTEVDLWVEHIGPVWKKEHSLMKQGLVLWYAAMQRNGLAPEGVNDMAQFVGEGLLKKGAGPRTSVH